MFHRLTRVGELRRRTTSFGAGGDSRPQASPREPRPDSKQQLGQKCDHRPLHYHTPTHASSRPPRTSLPRRSTTAIPHLVVAGAHRDGLIDEIRTEFLQRSRARVRVKGHRNSVLMRLKPSAIASRPIPSAAQSRLGVSAARTIFASSTSARSLSSP